MYTNATQATVSDPYKRIGDFLKSPKTDLESLISLTDELLAKPYNLDRIISEIEIHNRLLFSVRYDPRQLLSDLSEARNRWQRRIRADGVILDFIVDEKIQLIVHEAMGVTEKTTLLLEYIAEVTGRPVDDYIPWF